MSFFFGIGFKAIYLSLSTEEDPLPPIVFLNDLIPFLDWLSSNSIVANLSSAIFSNASAVVPFPKVDFSC